MLSGMDLASCTDLAVPLDVMQHVVRAESSHNPFAIGVVGGHLVRQPNNLQEALATVRMLESRGFNFSLGIAQVNRYNLGKFGLDSYEKAFQTCPNLQAGSRILAECYGRSGNDWGKSFSCYYSGNFVTGYRHGYVQKIYASMRQTGQAGDTRGQAIPLIAEPSRRVAGVSQHPVYATPAPSPTSAAPVRVKPSRIEPTQSEMTPIQPTAVALMPPRGMDVMSEEASGGPVRAARADLPTTPQASPMPPYTSAAGNISSQQMIDAAFVF